MNRNLMTRCHSYSEEITSAYMADLSQDRLLSSLNETPEASPEGIIQQVRTSLDVFVKDAEQFDDITMLCVEYKGTGPSADA